MSHQPPSGPRRTGRAKKRTTSPQTQPSPLPQTQDPQEPEEGLVRWLLFVRRSPAHYWTALWWYGPRSGGRARAEEYAAWLREEYRRRLGRDEPDVLVRGYPAEGELPLWLDGQTLAEQYSEPPVGLFDPDRDEVALLVQMAGRTRGR